MSHSVGDVRATSVKRVASAVGERPLVESDVHRYLAQDCIDFQSRTPLTRLDPRRTRMLQCRRTSGRERRTLRETPENLLAIHMRASTDYDKPINNRNAVPLLKGLGRQRWAEVDLVAFHQFDWVLPERLSYSSGLAFGPGPSATATQSHYQISNRPLRIAIATACARSLALSLLTKFLI